MSVVINSYAELGPYIDSVLKANGDFPVKRRHKDFWNTLTYTEFKTGTVPFVADPAGQPMKILVIGDSGSSNLIKALAGTGSLFDPNTGTIGRMPLGGKAFTSDQIKPIADWIDAKCPNAGGPEA